MSFLSIQSLTHHWSISYFDCKTVRKMHLVDIWQRLLWECCAVVTNLQRQCLLFTASCGGRFSGYNGTIISPNYPSNYDASTNCSWFISGPTGHYVTFTFDAFALELSDNCSNDYIEVREYNETGKVEFKFDKILYQVPLKSEDY